MYYRSHYLYTPALEQVSYTHTYLFFPWVCGSFYTHTAHHWFLGNFLPPFWFLPHAFCYYFLLPFHSAFLHTPCYVSLLLILHFLHTHTVGSFVFCDTCLPAFQVPCIHRHHSFYTCYLACSATPAYTHTRHHHCTTAHHCLHTTFQLHSSAFVACVCPSFSSFPWTFCIFCLSLPGLLSPPPSYQPTFPTHTWTTHTFCTPLPSPFTLYFSCTVHTICHTSHLSAFFTYLHTAHACTFCTPATYPGFLWDIPTPATHISYVHHHTIHVPPFYCSGDIAYAMCFFWCLEHTFLTACLVCLITTT